MGKKVKRKKGGWGVECEERGSKKEINAFLD